MDGGFLLGSYVGNGNYGSLDINHLLFANDTLIFCGANQDNIQSLRALLLCFQVISGLKVNPTKFKLVLV